MIAIAIHGGAGTIARARMTAAREKRYRAALERAVRRGHEVLRRGGTSLDAVTAAVVALEDSPLFNAGRGAVFNTEGMYRGAIGPDGRLHIGIFQGRTRST